MTEPHSPPPLPASLAEHAYHYLRQEIVTGRLIAGSPLRQEKLSGELGISRLPLREALQRLDVEGLVMLRPRRGYFVAALNTDEIEELFDIRATLEASAGYFAALNRTDQDIADISQLLTILDAITTSQPLDVPAFYKANRQFHQRFFACSRRRHLCRMLASAHDGLDPYIRMSTNISSVEASQDEHRKLFAALIASDGEKVAQLCRAHCEASCARLIKFSLNMPR